ncbi:MAG: hypothetical protein A2086_10345 [Spirochaetes bacterium GWD1_27_9]|nr:MAG: hypothetical protein A2Z98_14285 [Spirochaetes bacterium GWB1_27_13]OHD27716.1 MAG: hypothetical protein A2Y34_08785 [Spirochaetes bacterium GWC1_27_15]OHD43677.1 MAG: hypothetical protein A2086_10345 [Spirochaetes bacterium GWD1_27_9]
MNKKILIFFFIYTIQNIFSQNNQNDWLLQKILNNNWVGIIFTYDQNQLSYIIDGRSPTAHWTKEYGKVSIFPNSNELLFNIDFSEIDKDKIKSYKLKYYTTDKDLFYTEFIGTFPNKNSQVKVGSLRKYDDINIIIQKNKKIISDKGTYLREKPIKDSDYYECKIFWVWDRTHDIKDDIIKEYTKNVLKTDDLMYNAELIARSEKKYNIGNKQDYWYLIKYYSIDFPDPDRLIKIRGKIVNNVLAWVFGNDIELIDK